MRELSTTRRLQTVRWLLPLVLAGVAISARGQSKSEGPRGALAILERATRQYSNLKSYRITCRQTFSSRHGRNPSPATYTAIKALGGRYRLEGDDGSGTAVQVSNGKHVWVYHPRQNAFTRQPATGRKPNLPKVLTADNSAIVGAANLVQNMTYYSGRFKSARRVPGESLTLNGRTLRCYVIVLTNGDRKIPGPYPFTDRIWIEKESFKIRKIVEHYITTLNQFGSPPVTYPAATISAFPQVILNQPIPDSSFQSMPPPNARLVPAFRQYHLPPTPSPKPAEIFSIVLKSFSGSRVPLKSFRGRPILIDLWATWCAPCYEAFPELNRIYDQTRKTGLVVVSVDQSDLAKDAQAYIEKMHYPWQNFHDDGSIDTVFGTKAVPRSILTDAKGKVVFDKVGPTKQQLLAAIAKLGPRYAAALR